MTRCGSAGEGALTGWFGSAEKKTNGRIRSAPTEAERMDKILKECDFLVLVVTRGADPLREAYRGRVDADVKANAIVARNSGDKLERAKAGWDYLLIPSQRLSL